MEQHTQHISLLVKGSPEHAIAQASVEGLKMCYWKHGALKDTVQVLTAPLEELEKVRAWFLSADVPRPYKGYPPGTLLFFSLKDGAPTDD